MQRAGDILTFRLNDIVEGSTVRKVVAIKEQKGRKEAAFALVDETREFLVQWLKEREPWNGEDLLFPVIRRANARSRLRWFQRQVKSWAREIGEDDSRYSSHSMRKTKASIIYEEHRDLRAVQLLLNHSNIGSTAHYLRTGRCGALELAMNTVI